MVLTEEVEKYLHYCEFQKELDGKTIKAYRTDLAQFMEFMEVYDDVMGKEEINAYLQHIHERYRQKTVKRKIASVRALFRYLEEEEIIGLDPFHKVKTKFKEDTVLPKIIPKSVIERLLNYLYGEAASGERTKLQRKWILRTLSGMVCDCIASSGDVTVTHRLSPQNDRLWPNACWRLAFCI